MTPLDKPRRSVSRVTIEVLGPGHGADRGRRIVASLVYGDLLELRPLVTRRPQALRLVDVYTYALKCAVNRRRLELARARKQRLEERRARARLRRSILSNR